MNQQTIRMKRSADWQGQRGMRKAGEHFDRAKTALRVNPQAALPQTHQQMTPPLTPQTSQDSTTSEGRFPNYLRAFHSYYPTSPAESSTITLPLNIGDVILVHSVHVNGWADGTLLTSGARGWLPTNYCETYEHEPIRNLLHALMRFWDFIRDGHVASLRNFSDHTSMRGIIAGVRYLLETTSCLNRDSPLVVQHECLRRNRKALLAHLSSLVKCAKKVEESITDAAPAENVGATLDEMVLKAFKVVTRSIKFLDMWYEETGMEDGVYEELVNWENDNPPTPPQDQIEYGIASGPQLVSSHSYVRAAMGSDISRCNSSARLVPDSRPKIKRSKGSSAQTPKAAPRLFPQSSHPGKSSSKRPAVSHRLSYRHKDSGGSNRDLACTRLSSAHDAFLGYLGWFIGLHLQSRSPSELLSTTIQAADSCQTLLTVVDAVWDRDLRRSVALKLARDTMFARMYDLIEAAKHIFRPTDPDSHEGVLIVGDGEQLVTAATMCVKSAGDCVGKARFVIERIGDFEFESNSTLDVSLSGSEKSDSPIGSVQVFGQTTPVQANRDLLDAVRDADATPTPRHPDPVRDYYFARQEKALIRKPVANDRSPGATVTEASASSLVESFPLPSFDRPHPSTLVHGNCAGSKVNGGESTEKSKLETCADASISDQSICAKESESKTEGDTALSQTSTRVTTPERGSEQHVIIPCTSFTSDLSDSQTTLAEECEDAEAKVLEKTYAHELTYSKDGHVTGGSLPALIERLTTHESTPDFTFISTFVLTFRLFTTPTLFAKALIDRYDYISESPQAAEPVRFRIYQVFKYWLENQWRHDCDSEALDLILRFASEKLETSIPSAGKRLGELANKVSMESDAALNGSMEFTAEKSTQSSRPSSSSETVPAPPPAVSKSQLSVLRNWKAGTGTASIIDFDCLEVARQLTLKESKVFCAIQPAELLGTEWTKRRGSMAVNVRAMSTLSTDLANLVADTILQLGEPKKRAAVVKQWIKIAKECLNLQNYDSLMAIICSLNSSTILRLKRTWELVSQKKKAALDELKKVVDVSKNYAVLRQRLSNHIPPCIPFVGTYLTDLTFNDVGNQTTRQLPGDSGSEGATVINFDKHLRTARIIGDLQRFQAPYNLMPVPELQDWIEGEIQRVRASDGANVQSYYRRSLLLEPRDLPNTQKNNPPPAPLAALTGHKETAPFWRGLGFKDKFAV
ncbi:ras GEF [Xylona heveae TC161]|uniref:Ras GEF n=1 Tax=Xylona heveae (strain CBS 132557 / TC161) TaxID=1328760 RepID=A0A161THR5_XYLHT|nr:ras GEF [Xylona heveae TC161]KZF25817.1 ras GEF [Xylona heveae TC161]